ncbi:MAG: mechanosensitive ion channel [Proteobacteria bacterium]|nr:mechanosensitive ion channel [Pseudomonadota bacterium]
MLKILVFIGLTALYASQKPENIMPGTNEHNKVSFSKSPIITANPDYLKIKGTSKIVSDVDIDDVIAQKLMSNYYIGDIRKIFEKDQMLNIFMLLGRLGVILVIFAILWKTINRFTLRFVNSVIKSTHNYGEYTDGQSLANTAAPILNSILRWVLISITLLIVLTEIGVDIIPIIYSFGVLGLAISIGAQTLVRDIISGILTLFEGIVSVGEIVELNGQVGTIEAMSLRAIEFRHSNGKMQVVAFSEINSLLNLSRDYSICNIILPVAHDADLANVEIMFKDIFTDMKSDDSWSDLIIGDLNLSGVVSITETAVYISCLARTKPDPYDLFGKEFRKRLHIQMHERKIPSPKFTSIIMKG